jgi:hypothetical protein
MKLHFMSCTAARQVGVRQQDRTDQDRKSCPVLTYASNAEIGGVLHQITSTGQLQLVQYLSRSLSKREQKYSVIEKECLAIV